MWDQVKSRIDGMRPMLVNEKEDLKLVDVENGAVKIKLTGTGVGHNISQHTLIKIIEIRLKGIPGVKSVELT